MKVAIIGCGGIARAHAECVREFEEDRLVAVADIDREAAERFAAQWGGQPFPTVEDLLAKTLPDAAIVCTPPNTHREVVSALLSAGVPVLCEKPLAHIVRDAEALADLARETGLPAYVAYCHRFNPAARLMREYVRDGRTGRVHTFRNAFIGYAPHLTYAWRTEPDISGGGCLMDNGSHSIDLQQFILGPIVDVSARLHFDGQGRGDVAADVLAVGENGVAGLISVSYVSPRGEARFEIIGTEMSLEYDYATSGATVTAYRPGGEPERLELPGGCGVRFVEQYRAFREALQGRPTDLATFEEGLSVSRIVDRCQRQAGITGGIA
ncbi:MAG: oxidoreductase [Armatimonadota bacterium]|nr:MAG: oxidoreductase [Armatimonadota bacterium]